MTTREDAIKHIQNYNKPNEHICLIIWNVEDVLGRAKDRGMKITKNEAEEIIDIMEHRHDATIGVTWDTIDCYLGDLDDKRQEEEKAKNGAEKVSFT
jgi:hypothetical protein